MLTLCPWLLCDSRGLRSLAPPPRPPEGQRRGRGAGNTRRHALRPPRPRVSAGPVLPSPCRRTQTAPGRSVPALGGGRRSRARTVQQPHVALVAGAGAGAVLHRAPAAPGCLREAGRAEPLAGPEHPGDGGGLGGAELHPEKHPDPHVGLRPPGARAARGLGHWLSSWGLPQQLGAGCALPTLCMASVALPWPQFSGKLHLKT